MPRQFTAHLARAQKAVARMSNDQRAAHDQAQRQSFARGQIAMKQADEARRKEPRI